MGFLDSVQSAVNRGTAAAQRTGRSASLKMQLGDLMKQRKDLAAQLGASLYEITREVPEMRAGREALYDGIDAIDVKRVEIEQEIAAIEAEAVASAEAALQYKCPKCGSTVVGSDLFCRGCGISIEEIKAAAAAATAAAAAQEQAAVQPTLVCWQCGSALGEGDIFCQKCGAKQEAAPVEGAVESLPTEVVPEAAVHVAEVVESDITAVETSENVQ